MEVQNPFQVNWDKLNISNFTDFFFSKIAVHGSHLAMVDIDTGKQWRYSEIRGWCEMCATRLREIQVVNSSKVAIIAGTTGQTLFVQLACSLIGCLGVTINGFSNVDDIWHLVDLSESTHLIVEAQFLQKAEDVRRKAQMRTGGRIKHIRILDEVLSSETLLPENRKPNIKKEQSTHSLLINNENEEKLAAVAISNQKENDNESGDFNSDGALESDSLESSHKTFLIFFTSGTTSMPKPCEVTHKSVIINIQQMSFPLYGPTQPKERFLLPLALSHIFGTLSAYYALINGSVVYMLSKVTPKQLVDVFINQQINVAHITTAMVHWLSNEEIVKNYQFSTLRSLIVGGAPVDSNRLQRVKEKLQLKDLRQTYGMTELGGLCTLLPYEADSLTSVGQPLPGMLMKIVNWETKTICQPRKPGQLLVIGPQVSPSYFKNQKATSELLESNGYVRTGDAAYYDETGKIFIMDRIKDIIKYKGTLICPSEVEQILRAHPAIDDCAVVGRQDHVSGEVPAAFVVRNANFPQLSSAEVRQYVSGKIATFKELRGGVFFIPDIPRSVCGKLIRKQLRQFWDRERNNKEKETVKTKPKEKLKK
ncbi:unnamed protein product [Auanema sp. JU1783]|nr:unnamed protein product [Auanema sp. JU1783]